MSKQQQAREAATTVNPTMFATSGPQLAQWAAEGNADAQAELDRRNAKRVKSGKALLVNGKRSVTPEQQARSDAYKAMSPDERKAYWAAKTEAAKAAKAETSTATPVMASRKATSKATTKRGRAMNSGPTPRASATKASATVKRTNGRKATTHVSA